MREARWSARRFLVCSASSLMKKTGDAPAIAKVTREPYGVPAGSLAIVQSVPVAIDAASVRARSPCVGVGTAGSYSGPSSSPRGRMWASLLMLAPPRIGASEATRAPRHSPITASPRAGRGLPGVVHGLNWHRHVDRCRVDDDGIVDFAEYCAPAGTIVASTDRLKCCGRRTRAFRLERDLGQAMAKALMARLDNTLARSRKAHRGVAARRCMHVTRRVEHIVDGHHHRQSQANRRAWETMSHRFVWGHQPAPTLPGSATEARQ